MTNDPKALIARARRSQSPAQMAHNIGMLADALESSLAENAKLREAVKFIAEYPNGPDNHSDMCELHSADPQDDPDDLCCDCEYWSSSFPMLKIAALKAWRSLKAGS